MPEQHRRSTSGPGVVTKHSLLANPSPGLKSGPNTLYGSEMVAKAGMDSSAVAQQAGRPATASSSRKVDTRFRNSMNRKRSNPKGGSPQSTITTSTFQSSSSSGHQTRKSANVAVGTQRVSQSKGQVTAVRAPAPLVPALSAPVPPPRQRKAIRRDIETGEGEATLEDAPDKTLMESVQTYLKSQSLERQIAFYVIMVILAGGSLGAYVIVLVYAIRDQNTKYIVLVVAISLVFLWIIWKYCFHGDDKLQDQSAVAQDIAHLYATMPDHTARRGVSDRGRAQFTAFKYEKSEMMFTAVTDDGVSLGSERGSELMMDGADPSCPLCNLVYVEGADLCLLPCLHVFHRSCIHKWCNTNIVCPLCKRHLEAPEPLHTLNIGQPPLERGHSEPGCHHGAQSTGVWRQLLGAGSAGPSSGHGSLMGSRSEDGLWNDRVINAAQLTAGGGHHRVTSFSSETRRAGGARGRSGAPGANSNGRGGPPRSISAGTSIAGHQARSLSYSATSTGMAAAGGRIRRKRSSSFSNSSSVRGSGPLVAQGTAPERRGSRLRPTGGSVSPRSKSDLGLGAKDNDRPRVNSDLLLSKYAARSQSRQTSGSNKMGGRATAGDAANGAKLASDAGADSNRKMTVVTVSSKAPSKNGLQSQGQEPAVITVRKMNTPNTMPRVNNKDIAHRRVPSTDISRAGGGSDSLGGETKSDSGRLFMINTPDTDDDSPKTKALSYGPRKPRVAKVDKNKGSGHKRTGSQDSSHGQRGHKRNESPYSIDGSGPGGSMSTPAKSGNLSASDKSSEKPRRSKSQPVSRRKMTSESNSDLSSSRSKRHSAKVGSRSDASAAYSSGGESSSDGRPERPRRRTSVPSTSSSTRHLAQISKSASTKVAGPTTKGTPAPPMAAARSAGWSSSKPIPPAISASASSDVDDDIARTVDTAPATQTSDDNSPNTTNRSSVGRGWNIRIPMSASSGEFFGFGSSSGNTTGECDAGNTADSGSKSKNIASKMFASSGGSNMMGPARLFGSRNGPTSGGRTGFGTDSEDERDVMNDHRSGKGLRIGSVQTYEKTRSISDEKSNSDERLSSPDADAQKRDRPLVRRSSKGASNVMSVSDWMSEQERAEREQINRPRLSYKKKGRHSRTSTPPVVPSVEPPAPDLPDVNPDGDDWGSEEPYSRPKLTYGSGLQSSSRKAISVFDTSTSTSSRRESHD